MTKGVILIILAAFFWGSGPNLSRILYLMGSDPISVAAMRAYIGGLTVLIYALATGMFRKIKTKDIPFFAIYGLCAVTGLYTVYLLAVDLVSASVASILLYTAPSFVIIFSRIIYKEPITAIKCISLLISLIGCTLVVKLYDMSSFVLNFWGIFLGLLSGLLYSTLTLFSRRSLRYYDSKINAAMPILFGAFFMLFVKPVWEIPFSPGLAAGYFVNGLICSAIATVFYITGIQMGVEGGNAMLIATIEPIVATGLGMIIFHDILQPLQLLGMVLVLLGTSLPIIKIRYDAKKELEWAKSHPDEIKKAEEILQQSQVK